MPNYATKSDLNHATLIKNIYSIQTADASNLVKKIDYNTKTGEIEKKICSKIKRSKISNQSSYFDSDDKLKNIRKKVTSNKTKHVLVENEFKKL